MPRALTVCPIAGCPELTPGGKCPTHKATARRTQAAQRRATGDPSMAAYTTTTWRTTRHTHLTQHPTCEDCGHPATQADHVPPRQLLVALHIHNPDHPRWLHSRCTSCHSTKTARVDQPLLRRWQAGEPAAQLAEEAMRHGIGVGGIP